MDEEPQQQTENQNEQPIIVEEQEVQQEDKIEAEEGEGSSDKEYVDEVKIGGETIFTIPPEMQN